MRARAKWAFDCAADTDRKRLVTVEFSSDIPVIADWTDMLLAETKSIDSLKLSSLDAK